MRYTYMAYWSVLQGGLLNNILQQMNYADNETAAVSERTQQRWYTIV